MDQCRIWLFFLCLSQLSWLKSKCAKVEMNASKSVFQFVASAKKNDGYCCSNYFLFQTWTSPISSRIVLSSFRSFISGCMMNWTENELSFRNSKTQIAQRWAAMNKPTYAKTMTSTYIMKIFLHATYTRNLLLYANVGMVMLCVSCAHFVRH